jgi:hypothetical protein
MVTGVQGSYPFRWSRRVPPSDAPWACERHLSRFLT